MFTDRHPAHPVSVPTTHPNDRKQALRPQTTEQRWNSRKQQYKDLIMHYCQACWTRRKRDNIHTQTSQHTSQHAGEKGEKASCVLISLFNQHYYSPAQPVRGFTLSHLPREPWSQVCSLPPGTCLQLYRAYNTRVQSIPTFHLFMPVDFQPNLLTRALAPSVRQILRENKPLRARVCTWGDFKPRPWH